MFYLPIISVPSSLNSSQSGFISKLATIPTSFGCSGFFCEFASGKSADEHRSVPVVGAEAAVVGVVVADEPEIKWKRLSGVLACRI